MHSPKKIMNIYSIFKKKKLVALNVAFSIFK